MEYNTFLEAKQKATGDDSHVSNSSSLESPGHKFNELSSIELGDVNDTSAQSGCEQWAKREHKSQSSETDWLESKLNQTSPSTNRTNTSGNTSFGSSGGSSFDIWSYMTQGITKRARRDTDLNLMSSSEIKINGDSDSNNSQLNHQETTSTDVFYRKHKPENATILDQNRLPPDRWHHCHGWHNNHNPNCDLSGLSDLRPSCKNKRNSKLDNLLSKGNALASLLGGQCISKDLSKSHSKDSLRFNCRNGHNFYLTLDKLEESHRVM